MIKIYQIQKKFHKTKFNLLKDGPKASFIDLFSCRQKNRGEQYI